MKNIQNIFLAGRGSIGLAYASELLKSNTPMAFIVDPSRKERYEREGLRMNGQPVSLPYVTPEEASPADLILITTKMGALPEVMEEIAPFVGEDTILLSGINGIASEDILRQRFGREKVVRAIAQKMDARYDGNSVTFSTPGELVFGAESPEDEENVQALCSFFDTIHFPCVLSRDIMKDAWSKLMLNCSLNQICAVYGKTYGDVARDPELRSMFLKGMQEVQKTAASQGIVLEDSELEMWMKAVEALAPDSMPSMAQDVLAKRKTEKELFSGTILPLARQAGIEVPLMEELYRKLEEIENSW